MSKTERMSLKEFRESGLINKMQGTKSGSGQNGKRHSKMNAKKVVIDGITFDSGWEGERYQQLKLMERAGDIQNLKLQVPYPLEAGGIKFADYYADFVYTQNGEEVVEDAKGYLTATYKKKRRLMKEIYGIVIYESRKQTKSKKAKRASSVEELEKARRKKARK